MTDLYKDEDDAALERLLREGLSVGAEPPADLFARIARLAEAEQPQPQRAALAAPVTMPVPETPRRSLLADLFGQIGGWRLAGGLSTLMLVGFFLGFSGTTHLSAASASEQVDLMPVADQLFADTSAGE